MAAGEAATGGVGWAAINAPFWPQALSMQAAHKPSRGRKRAGRMERSARLCGTFNIARILSTMASTTPAATPLADADYRALTSAVLAGIEADVDRWLQDDVVDIDASRTGGLLELALPGGSKIIVNTQPPLQELWLAARSGGFHFKYVEGHWVDTKTGREFIEALSQCASDQCGVPLKFSL